MRVVQPHGPYVLIGHSFGGFVALEIARMLRSAGEEVDLVAILDTFPRDDPRASGTATAQTVTASRGPRRQGSAAKTVAKLVHRVVPYGLPARDQVGRHVRAHLAGFVTHEGQKQFDAIADRSVLALRKHVVEPYEGRALYVMAATNERGLAGWTDILTGDLTVETTQTDHTSLLREPGVQTLASILRQHLEPVASARGELG